MRLITVKINFQKEIILIEINKKLIEIDFKEIDAINSIGLNSINGDRLKKAILSALDNNLDNFTIKY